MKYLCFALLFVFVFACDTSTPPSDDVVFTKKHWLIGKWKAKAFNGELHETWELIENNLQKAGFYIEDGDTSYSEIVIIAGGQSMPSLRALPINRSVLEYEGETYTAKEMQFKSKTEKNPYQINYESIDKDHFNRIIYGDDEGIEYKTVFEFERMK